MKKTWTWPRSTHCFSSVFQREFKLFPNPVPVAPSFVTSFTWTLRSSRDNPVGQWGKQREERNASFFYSLTHSYTHSPVAECLPCPEGWGHERRRKQKMLIVQQVLMKCIFSRWAAGFPSATALQMIGLSESQQYFRLLLTARGLAWDPVLPIEK